MACNSYLGGYTPISGPIKGTWAEQFIRKKRAVGEKWAKKIEKLPLHGQINWDPYGIPPSAADGPTLHHLAAREERFFSMKVTCDVSLPGNSSRTLRFV